MALMAVGTALLLLGVRHLLHARLLRTGAGERALLLLSPNLTMVALAATTLMEHGASPASSSWLLLTGLFLSVGALLLLPPAAAESGPEDRARVQADSSTTLV